MKNEDRYLGSVRFYKHLILFTAAAVFFLPIIVLLFVLLQYGELKRDSDRILGEQTFRISRLEEQVAYYEGQSRNDNPDICLETEELEEVQEPLGAPEMVAEDSLQIPFEVDLSEVKYLLVNNRQPLSQSFEPDLVETRNGQLVHSEMKAPLEKMLNDAKKEGFDLIICSAYRDYEKQAKLVDDSIKKYRKKGCDYWEAYWKTCEYLEIVGRSEHHTGLAVDVVGISNQSLDETQADMPETKWLNENAYKYGFIVRYPKDKEEITGIRYESWHYRYVGKEAAAFMKENQLCLEEFVELASRQDGGE